MGDSAPPLDLLRHEIKFVAHSSERAAVLLHLV